MRITIYQILVTCFDIPGIDQVPPDNVPFNSDSENDMDEDAYDLREVSSDVEVNLDEVELDSDDDAKYVRATNTPIPIDPNQLVCL